MSLRIAFDCDGVIADLDSALAEITERLFGAIPPPAEPGDEPPAPAGRAGARADNPAASRVAGSPAAAAPETPVPMPAPATAAEQAPSAGEADADSQVTAEEEQVEPPRFRRLTRRQQHDIWDAVHHTENFWETLAETEPGIVARLASVARERGWEVIFITQRPSSAGDTTQLQTQRWLIKHGYDLPSVYVIKGTRGKVADALTLDIVVDDRPENCLDVKLESRARAILIWPDPPDTLPPNARRLGIEPVPSTNACLDLLTASPAEKPGLFSRLARLMRRESRI